MSIDLAITGGLVVEPGVGVYAADIGCSDGKIMTLASPGTIDGARETVVADGLFVMPGVFDPHIHVGIYQDLESDCLTETQAAISGGVTTVGVYIHAAESYFDVLPAMARTFSARVVSDVKIHATIDARHISEIDALAATFDINSFKLYLAGIAGVLEPIDDANLFRAFLGIAALDGQNIACVHAENSDLTESATAEVRETRRSPDLVDWEATRPGFCEAEAIGRASYLASEAKCPLYIVHVSSSAGARMLDKLRPNPGFVETTSPYLTCSIEDFNREDLWAKHLPPLRGRSEIDELWQAVADDRIDTIGTDHIAIARDSKTAASSILDMITAGPFIETHVPAVLTEGLKRGIPLENLVRKMTVNPAKAFGLYPSKGSLQVGADADIVIVDLETEREVPASSAYGSSDFSLIEGRKLIGWPEYVVKGGQLAYKDREVLLAPGDGRILNPALGRL